MRIPSPFGGRSKLIVGPFRGSPEALWFGSSQRGGSVYNPDGDRRLPIIRLSKDTQPHNLVYDDEEADGWDHLQYLGEHMVRNCLLVCKV
jgi:hypothetical protein